MQKFARDNWLARAAHDNIETKHQKQCDGFLGNLLSKGLKTNQLVVNTDEKTLRPIARLKEPRDLFALPKEKDNDCSQQAPRWPVECQVIGERIIHIPYVPAQPEPLNVPTGNELKPRPVGEENGIVVFSYCPISAVNYGSPNTKTRTEDKSSEDSDDSSDSRNEFIPLSRRLTLHSGKNQLNSVSSLLNRLGDISTSNSQDDDDDDDCNTSGDGKESQEKTDFQCLIDSKNELFGNKTYGTDSSKLTIKNNTGINDTWKNNSTEYKPASPHYVLSQFGKKVSKGIIEKIIDYDENPLTGTGSSTSTKVQNKYAVTPFKLPKTNISRLEVAFQSSSHQSYNDKTSISRKSNKVDDTDEDSDDDCSTEIATDEPKVSVSRLAGGADKRPSTSSSSVSDTETLVGGESMCRLASTDDKKLKPFPSVPTPICTRTVSMAAAVAAVARGRRRGFESIPNDIGVTHISTSTNTSTYEQVNDKPSSENNFNERASFQSQPLSYDIPQIQFSRSAVGGAKYMTNCHPMNTDESDSLEFESRFESGNLAKAVQITPTYYELYLRPDLYTSRSKQWFYFRVRRTRRNMLYRFSIVNLVKSDSLYNDGMRPVMYSNLGAKDKNEGWRRCGNNISYYRNDDESNNNTNEEDEDNSSYTLTFTIEFEHDDDTVYFAHSYPYTYSDLQDYLMEIQRHPVKSKFCKLRLLCRTLAGNNVYYLTVTAPSNNEDNIRRKKSIVVSARVHPSETPSSWMMKGLMDFITGDSTVAKRLRHKFIFKLVPMLNPDGVIVGNTRNSLTGKDLNRQYRTVIRETYPSIWYTKAMIRRLIEECGVAMYCDMHAHSRKHNIFIYGCENKRNPEKRLTEQVFPLMLHKNSADRFSFESCKFKIQRSKEGTGRIVVWMLGITNSYTIEASFGGSSLGSRKGTHFNTQDYEHMGRAFCETLLDYCDENPNKVKRHAKLFKQIKKIRKREKREQKALKLQKMADQILNLLKQQERLRSKIIERLMREGSSADEPLNIPLSDYSSDEGNCSSSSDNEGKHSITASDLEGPCCAPIRAPPSSPEIMHEIRKFRVRRMHKVMHVLDQIYFSPVLQRKFKALARLKRRRHKLGCKMVCSRRATGGGGGQISPHGNVEKLVNGDTPDRAQITIKTPRQSPDSESSESNGSQSSDLLTDASNDVNQTGKQSSRKRNKKKKHMSTEKCKTKALNRKMRIDRNLRLWLANRRIFIFRRKKNRRQRVRSKPVKKRGELVRTALDLPTTDPGSDLHFSTDDEELFPAGNVTFGAVAPLRHTLLQSELQRRYIEEIGDLVVQKPKSDHMPPELIVTTPSKSTGTGGVKRLDVYKLTPSTAPEQQAGQHSQTNVTGARRTYSWHNLNQDSSRVRPNFINESKPASRIHKTPPRRSVHSNLIPLGTQRHCTESHAKDLHVKLSMKRKIWTGAHGDPDVRPLAWYKGQAKTNVHMATVMATAAATAALRSSGGLQTHNMFGASNKEPLTSAAGSSTTSATVPPPYVGAPRRSRKLEQVDLFNACSQKLLLWQQEHKKIQPSNTRLMGGTSAKLEYPQIPIRGCKPSKSIRTASGNAIDVSVITGKSKRKSSMIKIAETTQLVTRFSRTHSSARGSVNFGVQKLQQTTQMQRLILKTQPGSGAEHAQTASISGMQHSAGRTANKFKASGLVLTAVQQDSGGGGGGVSRRMRHAGGSLIKSGSSGIATGAHKMLQYRNTNTLPANKSVAGISLDTVSLVRKVKTKLKKRKSRTVANVATK
ncbi:cytosolic carboxypeptidase Nna1 isoform X2 [Drosophila novamexicana]|uniref:cytosolic carboxypeptidase Nna1 isoform X2 n=1 Tax=Drosophila novamexicana TaxID=47314 RepID=UPI0011E5972B|nr:cytosolic carboxypeptidase Nna1 isoform X2 [Drosophila novamexicana]